MVYLTALDAAHLKNKHNVNGILKANAVILTLASQLGLCFVPGVIRVRVRECRGSNDMASGGHQPAVLMEPQRQPACSDGARDADDGRSLMEESYPQAMTTREGMRVRVRRLMFRDCPDASAGWRARVGARQEVAARATGDGPAHERCTHTQHTKPRHCSHAH